MRISSSCLPSQLKVGACLSMNQMAEFSTSRIFQELPAQAGNAFQSSPEENMKNLPEAAVKQLRDHVLLMGGEVERAIDQATRALIERDSDLAAQVLRDDDRVDALELEADQLCVRLLALQSSES